MLIRLLFLLIFILSCNLMFGQEAFKPKLIRQSILALTKQIPTYNDSAMTEYLQVVYDTVFKRATDNELYELTNHNNPLVRRSSLNLLLERYSSKVLNLLHKNAGDTNQYFQIQYGCVIEKQTFLDELLFYLSPQSGWDRNFKMTNKQRQTVSEMIVRREKERLEYFWNR